MSAKIIDGKAIASQIRSEIALEVCQLKSQGITPCLAVILVGENPASVSYVSGKQKALAEVGMEDRSIHLPENTSELELLNIIEGLNNDKTVHGILVQLPLPNQINEDKIIMAIDPKKDVDGFHPMNLGNLLIGRECFLPCTPNGIIVLLEKMKIETCGKHAVVIGRSNIVGKPVSVLLAQKKTNCTVTICHTGTKNICEFTKSADILIVASGHPHTVTKDMIKKDCVVIDVGVNRIADSSKKSGFRLVGDCDYEQLLDTASFITPVPGGVGPMTIAMLMQNTLFAAKKAYDDKCDDRCSK
ncbi:MAG: bifunctional methylenetetrahydrofolate dehydrogenase/methenyltetrahydrofolate cyclohydrolase FolD [Treponemataceae bacterium]